MTTVDIDLLNRHKAPREELVVTPGCFTNWLGLRTDSSIFANADALSDKVFAEIPSADDGVYGSYAEYAPFLTAIEQASTRRVFNAVELGAGWGPWISGIGKVCQRLGFVETNLIGVEADDQMCGLMGEHLARNGVTAQPMHGAAWHEDRLLRFPVIPRQDHGAAPSTWGTSGTPDYRGVPQQYVEVPGYRLTTICKQMPIVDYMHWDIQGAELAVALADSDFLNDRVRSLFIGTHSRPIEGGLIEFFFRHKWDILHQSPCSFKYDRSKPTIEGMTSADGELFALNPRLVNK